MRAHVIPILMTVLIVGAMLFQGRTADPVLAELPVVTLPEIEGFTSRDEAPSEAEIRNLPSDTRFSKRVYTDEAGLAYRVSLVFSGRSKSSIHRPELCLPTQGALMLDPRTLTVDGIDWHCLTLKSDTQATGFAYTFFNQAGFRTSSHMSRVFRDVWDRSVHGRIDRWVMVTVQQPFTEDADVAAFLGKLKGVIP